MRDLIGHLVARSGAERGAARKVVGISGEFLCGDDEADRIHVLTNEESIGAGIFTNDTATGGFAAPGSFATDSPITIVYASEGFLDLAILRIAGAIPDLGLFD